MANTTNRTAKLNYQNTYNKTEKLSKSLAKTIAKLSGINPEGIWHDIKDLYKYGGPIFEEYVIGGFKEAHKILNESLKEAKEKKTVRPLIKGVCKSLATIYKGFTGFFSRFPDLSNFLVTTIQTALIYTSAVFFPIIAPLESSIFLASKALSADFKKPKLSNKDLVAEIIAAKELKKATLDLHKAYPEMKDVEELAISTMFIQKHHNISPEDLLSLGLTNEQIHKLANLSLDSTQVREFIGSAKSFQRAFQDYDHSFHAADRQKFILSKINPSTEKEGELEKTKEERELEKRVSSMFTNYKNEFGKKTSNKFPDQFNTYTRAYNKLQEDLKNLGSDNLEATSTNTASAQLKGYMSKTLTHLDAWNLLPSTNLAKRRDEARNIVSEEVKSTFLSSQMIKILNSPIYKELNLDRSQTSQVISTETKKQNSQPLPKKKWVERVIAGEKMRFEIDR